MYNKILRYKYVPIDDSFKKPFDQKGSLSIIKDGTIKFTHPREFNDPFDCRPEIDFSGCLSQNFWKNIGREFRYSPARRIQEKSKLIQKLEKNTDNYFERINSNIGVCCLSRNPLNLLMWAHYASSHTGFVIEFSIPIKSTSNDDISCLVPFPVEYENNKPIDNNPKLALKNHALTKGKDWEYEQEERVLDFSRKPNIYPYDRKQILKSVIAGMRMNNDDFATLKNTVDTVNKELGMNVTIHKAESVKGKYALFVQNRDDLNFQCSMQNETA